MHVAVDARELGERPTGLGRYLSELIARWSRTPEYAEHRFTLYSPDPAPERRPWWGQGGASVAWRALPGARGTRWEQWTFAAALRRDRPDVIFAPGYSTPVLTGRIPAAVVIHDVSFFARPEWFRPREGFRRRLLARAAARRAAAVITVSEFSRREIRRVLRVPADRLHVVFSAVDSHPALSRAGDEKPVQKAPLVLFAGSIFNRRHVPLLIEAFTEAARTRPAARLEIVGDDRTWPPERIADRARQSLVADRIRFRSYVTDEDLQNLYTCASVFVFLSEYEGFGLTPLEALRAGAVPIVLDTPVARESLGGAACFVPELDAQAVARLIGRYLDDPSARAEIEREGRQVLARYTWDRTARETFGILATIATRR